MKIFLEKQEDEGSSADEKHERSEVPPGAPVA